MSFKGGFLVFTKPGDLECSVCLKHVVKVTFNGTSGTTTVYLTDSTFEVFQTSTDDLYQRIKKEISVQGAGDSPTWLT